MDSGGDKKSLSQSKSLKTFTSERGIHKDSTQRTKQKITTYRIYRL